MNVNLSWITKTLWAFMCQNMTKEFTRGLTSLVGGPFFFWLIRRARRTSGAWA